MHGKGGIHGIVPKGGTSNALQGICKAKTTLTKGLQRNVHNGTFTKFWKDKWIMPQLLIEFIKQHEIHMEENVRDSVYLSLEASRAFMVSQEVTQAPNKSVGESQIEMS
nr:uncharacterized protein LOC109174182 [Ipomoea batatas]